MLALLGFAVFRAAGSLPVNEINQRNRVVSFAESQLGVREATGRNDGADVKKYLAVTGLSEGHPWCAAFVSWVFVQSDIKTTCSARVVDWFKSNVVYGRNWQKDMVKPEKAMVAGFYYPELKRYGHIGIVCGITPGLKDIITIEGNTNSSGSREGQGVYRKIRPLKTIAVFADPCLNKNCNINKPFHQ